MAAILNFAATGHQGAPPNCSQCFFKSPYPTLTSCQISKWYHKVHDPSHFAPDYIYIIDKYMAHTYWARALSIHRTGMSSIWFYVMRVLSCIEEQNLNRQKWLYVIIAPSYIWPFKNIADLSVFCDTFSWNHCENFEAYLLNLTIVSLSTFCFNTDENVEAFLRANSVRVGQFTVR